MITWKPGSDATFYNIYWSTTPGITTSTAAQIPMVTSPYIHLGLNNGTPYCYVVTSVNGSGESAPSPEVCAVPRNRELYVANFLTDRVSVFSAAAEGDSSPLRTFGSLTGMSGAFSVALDTVNGEIAVANTWNNSITVFTLTSSGNMAPLRTIAGPSTGLKWLTGVAVDTVNNEILVTDGGVMLLRSEPLPDPGQPPRFRSTPQTVRLSLPMLFSLPWTYSH
jgi:DNA-binding beta-propeller fold protein YncE